MSFERVILEHMPEVESREPCHGYVIFNPATNKYLSEGMDPRKSQGWQWFNIPQNVVFAGTILEDPIEERMLRLAQSQYISMNIDLHGCMLIPAVSYVGDLRIDYVEVYVKVDFVNAFNFLDTIKNSV